MIGKNIAFTIHRTHRMRLTRHTFTDRSRAGARAHVLSKYEDLPHKHYASMKAQHAMSNHARTLRRSQQHIPCPRTLSLTAICGYNWMAATTDRP